MKQDMNLDLGLESFLEPDSDFIEELCEHLEIEGIHLTNELLKRNMINMAARDPGRNAPGLLLFTKKIWDDFYIFRIT